MLSFIIHINIFSVKYSNSASFKAGARESTARGCEGQGKTNSVVFGEGQGKTNSVVFGENHGKSELLCPFGAVPGCILGIILHYIGRICEL